MLLPSAFPCEAGATTIRPSRPKLISLAAYQPIPLASVQQAQQGLIASCRALQNLLGNSLPSPRLLTKTTKKELRNPFASNFAQATIRPQTPPPPPRGANKRRRDTFEADKEKLYNTTPSTLEGEEAEKTFSTPKRQRLIPLSMPLGLSAADFASLSPPPSLSCSPTVSLPSSSPIDHSSDSGYASSPSPPPETEEWTLDDDRILVETVLEKLQLSKRAWNDCARKLAKDKDSLGRRWRELVDEGNVGLKMGGRMGRVGLDVGSW